MTLFWQKRAAPQAGRSYPENERNEEKGGQETRNVVRRSGGGVLDEIKNMVSADVSLILLAGKFG